MNEKLNVFLLAAGLGERLRPITDHIPKPLIPVLGKPVLHTILEKILTLHVNKIGINLCYKKEMIEEWINQSAFNKRLERFPEEPLMGTGGALKNAEAFLNSGTFIVHNSDILSDMDLKDLLEFHLSSNNLVTLAVHDYPEFNNLAIDEKGLLRGIARAHHTSSQVVRWLAFTGVAVYSPGFLKFLPSDTSSVVDGWLNAIAEGFKIGTLDISGCYWNDIGTPALYAKVIIDELRKNGEMVYIHPSTDGCQYVELDGYVVIEKESILDKGVFLRNCIMLPGSHAEGNSHYENCILGTGFTIDLSYEEMFDLSRETEGLLIGTGGSDRRYYRVRGYEHPTVLMKCTEEDTDFQRHIEYSCFFKRYSIPVPELVAVESDKICALFEDLGDLSLYSWLKCRRDEQQIEEIYKRVIDMLILIHAVATEHVSECPFLQNRVFDYEHLCWETSYFIERFLEGIRHIKVNNLPALKHEFHRLAVKVDSFHKTVIHRDFQSQNIMITKGGIPRLLDYQGARIGPPAYDVVSLLRDPYYRLGDDLRERLLGYYITQMTERLGGTFNSRGFRETLLPCRLQRHMQALGAYGFLSKIKGKQYFLKYALEGLRLLKEDVTLSKHEYPLLYDFVMGL